MRNVESTTSILSKILSLFLSKSGLFYLEDLETIVQIECLDNPLLVQIFDLSKLNRHDLRQLNQVYNYNMFFLIYR